MVFHKTLARGLGLMMVLAGCGSSTGLNLVADGTVFLSGLSDDFDDVSSLSDWLVRSVVEGDPFDGSVSIAGSQLLLRPLQDSYFLDDHRAVVSGPAAEATASGFSGTSSPLRSSPSPQLAKAIGHWQLSTRAWCRCLEEPADGTSGRPFVPYDGGMGRVSDRKCVHEELLDGRPLRVYAPGAAQAQLLGQGVAQVPGQVSALPQSLRSVAVDPMGQLATAKRLAPRRPDQVVELGIAQLCQSGPGPGRAGLGLDRLGRRLLGGKGPLAPAPA